VFTNITPFPQFQPVTNGVLTIPPAALDGTNSVVGQLVTTINNLRAQFKNADESVGVFDNLADIFSTPQLSEQSPFLNWNSTAQQQFGISDEAYEIIPAQLLPLLRQDSNGALTYTNGTWSIQFSGSDGSAYGLQTSSDLIHWNSESTNYPMQGHFNVSISAAPNFQRQFYRSVMLP
jgi:hypothetical protein